LCEFDDRGVYTIVTSADLYDASSDKTTVLGAPTTFTYPERTVVDVDGAVTRLPTYDGRSLKFRLSADATPLGSIEGSALNWKYKLDVRAPVTVWQGAGDRYTYSREFRFHSGLHKVVIWKNGVHERTLKIHVK